MAYLRGADCGDCSNPSPCGCCGTIVVDDDTGGTVDFSGTYYLDGDYEDEEGTSAPKWTRSSPSTAYIHRQVEFWVISDELGEYDPGHTQSETGVVSDCPTDLIEGEGFWYDEARELTVECA